MYERNAIIIERFFNNLFGYNLKNNIKFNYSCYCELIDSYEKYKAVTEEEEEIIIEYDIIANKIRDIQKKQENYNKKIIQLQQDRSEIFQNIDEDANLIQKKLDIINKSISDINEEIKENADNFTNIVAEFNEKSLIRNKCGKKRRIIEKEYNDKLNETLENYKNIDINLEKRAKEFIESDSTEIEIELKNKIKKNGEKEKVPFNEEAIKQAIIVSIDVQKRETDILSKIYEKTNKLFSEIKNNSIKIEKHKKIITDSNCKLNLILAIKEYIIQFLDNERLAAVNGENEYKKLIKEACKNATEDLVQINNLYALLIKEITKKATKKSYMDLYKIEYLNDLEAKAEEFENQVKKLNLPVAVINPNHWRIEGMKRIYEIFNKCVTEEYDRDLKEFFKYDDIEDADDEEDTSVKELSIVKEDKSDNNLTSKESEESDEEEFEEDDIKEKDNKKSDIDRKIDIILGLQEDEDNIESTNNSENYRNDEDNLEYDKWDEDIGSLDEDEYFEDEMKKQSEEDDEWDDIDNLDEDEYFEDEIKNQVEEDDEWNDIDNLDEDEMKKQSEEDDEWNDDEENENDNNIIRNFDETEDSDEEADYDIWGNNITKKNKQNKTEHNRKKHDDDWGNEFINIDNKEKNKKNKFFNKFKR